MSMITVAGVSLTVAGGTVIATAGWSTPQGLSAFLVALTGLAALLWSIYSAMQNRQSLNREIADEIADAIVKAQKKVGDEG